MVVPYCIECGGFHGLFSSKCAAIDNVVPVCAVIVTAYTGVVLQVLHDDLESLVVVFAVSQVDVILLCNVGDAIDRIVTTQRDHVSLKILACGLLVLFKIVE